jgi:hypothetical protein
MALYEPEVAGGNRTTLDVLQAGRKPDEDRDIYDLEPNATPLLRFMTRLNKRVTIQPEFNWTEDQPMPWWVHTDGAVADGVITSVVLDTGHGAYCPPGTLLFVAGTEEIMRVRAVSGDTLTVERSVTAVAGAVIPDDTDLRLLGDGFSEGSDAAVERSTVKVHLTNNTQIFKSAFGASGTQEQAEMWWKDNDRSRERRTRAIDHNIKIESAFLFGDEASYIDPDTGKVVRLTKGITNFIVTLVDAIGGVITADNLEFFLERLFRYSSKGAMESQTKWLFISRMVSTAINKFARESIQTVPKEKTFGVQTVEYVTPLGTVSLIVHNLLENNAQAASTPDAFAEGTVLGVDPESPTYRFMRNRDTKMMTDIQLPGSDTWKDQYQSEVGLQFVREEANGMMTGITRT